jgi:YidC/Oxa1 family membrane protein insertase
MKFDKNTIIGFALMIIMLLAFTWYQTNEQKAVMKEQARLDSLAMANAPAAALNAINTENPAAAASVSLSDSAAQIVSAQADQWRYGLFAAARTGQAQDLILKNNKVAVTLSTQGGMITTAEMLTEYKNFHTGENVKLWSDSLSAMKLVFYLNGQGPIKSNELYFQSQVLGTDAEGHPQTVSMKLQSNDPTKYIEYVYQLLPDAYQVNCKLNIVGLDRELELSSKPVALEWFAMGNPNEKGLSAERQKCSVFYRENGEDRDYLSETSSDELRTEKDLNWMAFKQDYFSAAVIAPAGFKTGSYLQVGVPTDSVSTKNYFANLILPLSPGSASSTDLQFYLGPNDYKELKSTQAEEFDRIIDYGWSIIGTVNRYCIRPLFWFFQSFIGSWGLIILLVTLTIKTVLFPITWKNLLSSAKMRVLKPEIDEINKKFEGKDPIEKQQATMSLYRQTGVNPFAGCIPVLLQMPILYAMFRFFPAEIVLRGKSFWWADDLAAYDSIFSWERHIPILSEIYGNHISGFTILMCISTYLYSQMSMGSQPQMAQQPGMPNMKVMMNLFTIMMLFFFNNQASGLALYYFIANMTSIGQMWVIKKYFIDEDAIRAKIDNNKKKPKSKSSFMQRLEEAQKAQKLKLDQVKKQSK